MVANGKYFKKTFEEKTFNSYPEATWFAKRLAQLASRPVYVLRNEEQWIARWPVLVDTVEDALQYLSGRAFVNGTEVPNDAIGNSYEDCEAALDFGCGDEGGLAAYWREEEDDSGYDDQEEEIELIRNEAFEDMDCWAQSEEEGWYYNDD